MNNNLYTQPSYIPSQSAPPSFNGFQNGYNQTDYAEYILKRNIGKRISVYVSFTDSIEWRDSVFTGILEDAGKDYLLIHDTTTGRRYMIWGVYVDYIVFDENVNK